MKNKRTLSGCDGFGLSTAAAAGVDVVAVVDDVDGLLVVVIDVRFDTSRSSSLD